MVQTDTLGEEGGERAGRWWFWSVVAGASTNGVVYLVSIVHPARELRHSQMVDETRIELAVPVRYCVPVRLGYTLLEEEVAVTPGSYQERRLIADSPMLAGK